MTLPRRAGIRPDLKYRALPTKKTRDRRACLPEEYPALRRRDISLPDRPRADDLAPGRQRHDVRTRDVEVRHAGEAARLSRRYRPRPPAERAGPADGRGRANGLARLPQSRDPRDGAARRRAHRLLRRLDRYGLGRCREGYDPHAGPRWPEGA